MFHMSNRAICLLIYFSSIFLKICLFGREGGSKQPGVYAVYLSKLKSEQIKDDPIHFFFSS